MRIDSHVHAFPDRLALAVRSRLGNNGNGTLSDGPLLDAVAQAVHARGFDAAWILPYAHRAGVAESVNEWSAAEVSRYPWLVAGATFHPADDDLPRLVERALVELRLRVVKLHCAVGQFSPRDRRLEPLWHTASQRRVPIVIHAGQRSGGATESDEVEELIPVLEAYPGVPIVLAHSGYPAVDTTLELMQRFDNLYGDLTPVWLSHIPVGAGELRRFPGRFLFGSDAPNSPLRASDHAIQFDAMALSALERDSLLGGAAAALTPITHVLSE